jgi:putative nucleotidyltransferase with HDIG domain
MAKADTLGPFVRRLQQAGVERMTVDRGVTLEEITAFLAAITTIDARDGDAARTFPLLPHIRVGRVTVDQRIEGSLTDMATIKRLYSDAVSVAGNIFDSAQSEGRPDATAARSMIDGLAQAVAQNRTALLALTTLKNYDNYTFTHMVNVSILTMGQARGLGIDGPLLREFGLAALMHDIGKVRTPLEVLNKPDKLTDEEYAIMKRHSVLGCDIVQAADMPVEARWVRHHHERFDGRGYPDGLAGEEIPLESRIILVADAYEAMTSDRPYRKAPGEEIAVAELRKHAGSQFDPQVVAALCRVLDRRDRTADAEPALAAA